MPNNKELFLNWMQNLFYVQCVALALALIAKLPFIGSWFNWVIRITTIATIFMLYKLSPLNKRYLKSAIFMGVTILTSIFLKGLGILAIVSVICSIIAVYQEYMGHSEVIKEVDSKLSKKWNSLFNWELWGGFLIGGVTAPIVVAIGLLGNSNVELATNVVTVVTTCFTIILDIVYLMIMKCMIKMYAEYEPKIEENV